MAIRKKEVTVAMSKECFCLGVLLSTPHEPELGNEEYSPVGHNSKSFPPWVSSPSAVQEQS